MEITENDPEIIGELDYLLTEEDYISSTDIYLNRLTKSKRKTLFSRSVRIAMMFAGSASLYILFAFSLYMSRGTDDGFPGVILSIALLYTALTVFMVLSPKIIQKNNDKALAQKRDENEFETPAHIRFYSGGVEMYSENLRYIAPYDAFARIFECKEGLFMVHMNGIMYFIPARYFDRQCAERVTEHLFQKLVMRYTRDGVIDAPETPENPGNPAEPSEELEHPRYNIAFNLDTKTLADTARIVNVKKIMLIEICLVLFAVILFIFQIKTVWLSSFVGIVRTMALTSAVVLLFISLATGRNPQPVTERCGQQYYSDHVTMKHGGNVQKFRYTMIKRVFRHWDNVVVMFKDNVFIYAPKSAFGSDDKFIEFEKFMSGFANEK